jgi:phosphoribosylanthranilate isomerase
MKFLVKICGITEEDDAAVALEAGANALGFNFYPRSPRYVTPERAAEMANAVRGNYLRVGVFVNAGTEELQRVAEQVSLDVLQLHGDQTVYLPAPYRLWKSIDPSKPLTGSAAQFEAYLLDTPSESFGGSGVTFPWRLAAEFPHRFLLAGGLDAGNVAEAIAAARPWGVDACSRIESHPGRKDARRVREFVRAAQAAAGQLLSSEFASL